MALTVRRMIMKSRLGKIVDKIRSDFSKTTGINLDVNVMTPETFRRA